MAKPGQIPVSRLTDKSFVRSVRPTDLVYFLCNVGDGDSQVILLPEERDDAGEMRRRIIVVDAATKDKVPNLLRALASKGLLGAGHSGFDPGSIALVIATHPHDDHIGGIAQLLDEFPDAVAEFWDPGYFHTSGAYHRMMAAVEKQSMMLYAQPTSGLRRWIGDVVITVLSPSIQLRNRFDTYGVEPNDSSISVKLEYPAARLQERTEGRNLVRGVRPQSLILGGDAQTLSWSYVMTDFPYLASSESDVAKAMGMATGKNPLKGHVLKVSHHASKHGVNLELVEKIAPAMTLISSVASRGKYNFPHTIAQEIVREALEATTSSDRKHKKDYLLHVFYTCDKDTNDDSLGSMAVVVRKNGRPSRSLWRFGDSRQNKRIDLDNARRMRL